MKIEKNTTVMIKYTLKDSSGTLLESTEGVGGVAYLHGRGLMIPGLEEALEGREQGESLTVSLSAEDSYGARDEELVVRVPRADFVDPETIEIGEDIQVHDDINEGIMKVVGISDDEIILDGNHPFSGRDVIFDISVMEVRPTTEEDLEALHNQHHDCGCGHDHSGDSCCGSGSEDESGGKGCCGSGGGCCGNST